MYGHGGWDADNNSFTKDINSLEDERIMIYSSKIDVANNLDNNFSDQHKICSLNNLGHSKDLEMGSTEIELAEKECHVTNLGKREY